MVTAPVFGKSSGRERPLSALPCLDPERAPLRFGGRSLPLLNLYYADELRAKMLRVVIAQWKLDALQSNMATPRITHDQREQEVLTDLERHFPNFAGQFAWTKVPEGQDPPDFLSRGSSGPIGLELIEWLDGEQMGPAKGRESQRDAIRRILADNWQAEYQPQNFRSAVIEPKWGLRIIPAEESTLKTEFFACAKSTDKSWLTNPERVGSLCYENDFSTYPMMGKYFAMIRYAGGEPHGFCWVDVEEDGGAYDPVVTVLTLEQAINKKLSLYSTPEKQAQLNAHGLAELYLLVHGGFNAYRYNTPSGPLSLDQIAQRGADFYAAHPERQMFDRVWFFDSLDSADEVNQLLGYPPGYGRVRWLAQLWPNFTVYSGSVAA